MQVMIPIFTILLASMTRGYMLPGPSGKYNVTLTTGPLIDYSRNDPFAATPRPRALMLSVFQPVKCASTVAVPYMPNKTAEFQGPYLQENFDISANLAPLFLEARLPVCPSHCSRCPASNDESILLFSPGYAVPRLYYNVLASAIASEGFTVITIDHPEDTNIITYPDGHTVYNNASIDPTQDEYIRAADASFIIDQLSNMTAVAELLPQRGLRSFSTDRIAILGHSLGGATAVIAVGRDSRLRGAINWDGPIYGSLPSTGVLQPVLFMGHANSTSSTATWPFTKPSWTAAWPKLKGPKLWVTIADTTHQTFLDAPTMLQAAHYNAAPFVDLLGTIAPARMVQLLTAYTTAWMNGVFSDGAREPWEKYPEVSTWRRADL